MTKFHIRLKDKSALDITVPDLFSTRTEAKHFIETWNLHEYEPEIIEISEERYLQAIKARLDLGAYEAHKELLRDFGRQVDEQRYDLTDDGTGKKYDTGKSMVGTALRIFASALLGIGACITFGQSKYPKSDNWKLVENGMDRYTDSLIRHLTKFHSGEELDPETGLPHLFHCGWNMLAIIEFYIKDHPELLKEIRK